MLEIPDFYFGGEGWTVDTGPKPTYEENMRVPPTLGFAGGPIVICLYMPTGRDGIVPCIRSIFTFLIASAPSPKSILPVTPVIETLDIQARTTSLMCESLKVNSSSVFE